MTNSTTHLYASDVVADPTVIKHDGGKISLRLVSRGGAMVYITGTRAGLAAAIARIQRAAERHFAEADDLGTASPSAVPTTGPTGVLPPPVGPTLVLLDPIEEERRP